MIVACSPGGGTGGDGDAAPGDAIPETWGWTETFSSPCFSPEVFPFALPDWQAPPETIGVLISTESFASGGAGSYLCSNITTELVVEDGSADQFRYSMRLPTTVDLTGLVGQNVRVTTSVVLDPLGSPHGVELRVYDALDEVMVAIQNGGEPPLQIQGLTIDPEGPLLGQDYDELCGFIRRYYAMLVNDGETEREVKTGESVLLSPGTDSVRFQNHTNIEYVEHALSCTDSSGGRGYALSVVRQ